MLQLFIQFNVLALTLFSSNLVAAKEFQNVSVKNILDSDDPIYVDYGDGFSDRKLQQGREFSNIRIVLNTDTLERQISESSIPNVEAKGQLLMQEILPAVVDKWSKALSVVPASNIFFPSETACKLDFPVPDEWAKLGAADTDLVMFIGAFDTFGDTVLCNQGTLASASGCNIDQLGRPVVGFINVCLDALTVQDGGTAPASDITKFIEIMVHEVGHALGVKSLFLNKFRNAVTGERFAPANQLSQGESVMCVDGITRDNIVVPPTEVLQFKDAQPRGYYEVVTPTVRQVARNQFACQSVTGARLENQPTGDGECFGSHFDERLFYTNVLSAFYAPEAAFFSPLILAYLEDSGHYRADYDVSQNSPFGLGAGCDFVNGKCIVNDSVPDYGKGFFCDKLNCNSGQTWQCDPSHQARGFCDLFEKTNDDEFTYFSNKKIVSSFQNADFCPIVSRNIITCDDEDAAPVSDFEVFSSTSRCTDVIINGSNGALCLRATCNKVKRSYDFFCWSRKRLVRGGLSGIKCSRSNNSMPTINCCLSRYVLSINVQWKRILRLELICTNLQMF